MGSKLITPPVLEPVTLDELKAHARIDGTGEDALLTSLIGAARVWIETLTRRALIDQTWKATFDRLAREDEALSLPHAPLASVTSASLIQQDGTSILWDSANYVVDTASEPGRIYPRDFCGWPSLSRRAQGFEVVYVAGYGADGASVPAPIRLALMQLAAFWYEQRGDETSGQADPAVPAMVLSLLMPYRILGGGRACRLASFANV